MSDDPATEILAAIKGTQDRAEEVLREAHTLHEHGFSVVEVIGSDRLLWKKEGILFTREKALSLIWMIEEDRS